MQIGIFRISGLKSEGSGCKKAQNSQAVRSDIQIIPKDQKSEPSEWIFPILGWCMIGHFAFVAARCVYYRTPEDIFWVSHVGTLLGGIGTLLINRPIASIALVCLLGHHLFWLLDTFGWLISGRFPFGTTAYLKEAAIGGWLQSANHFFSVPFLVWVVYRLGGISKHAWRWSTAIFAILVFFSFWVLPPAANVNSAHRLWPGLEQTQLSIIAKWPWGWYALALIGLNGLGNYLPANLVLRGFYALLFKGREVPTVALRSNRRR